jgi:membrane-associated phospholipid phosphatase
MIRRNVFLILCMIAFGFNGQLSAQSQPVYSTHTAGDLIAIGGSWGLAVTGHLLGTRKYKFDPTYFASLDRSSVNPFDRTATRNWSPGADRASDVTFMASGLGGLGMLLLDRPMREEWRSWLLMGGEVFFLTDGLTFIAKNTVRRIRPFAYNPAVSDDEKQNANVFQSFFSGHSSFTAAASFFAAKVYHDCHPGSKWRFAVWGGAGLLSGTTALLRVKAGRHYPTDVIAGVAVGALIGILVPEIHRNKRSPADASSVKLEFSPAIGMQGLRVGLRF